MSTVMDLKIAEIAKELNIEEAAIRAVNEVESGGKSGFLPDGRIMILFEGHVFWKELKKLGVDPSKHVKGNENVLYPSWTKKHYVGGAGEHTRLEKAMRINVSAAIASASWGKFQIMGNNFRACGYNTVEEFIRAQKEESNQLESFVNFIKTNNLVRYLREKNWAKFARGYNGASYAANKYDIKLETAYHKYKKLEQAV